MPAIQFSGLATGIDSVALIDSIIEARNVRNKLREQDIEHLNSENDSLEEFNSKLLTLNNLIDRFRSVNGGGINKRASSSDTSVATATAGSNAANSTTQLTVTSLAKAATGSFDQTYSSATSYVSTVGSGNLELTVGDIGDPEAVITVAVTQNSTTVQGLVDAINNASGASGNISASLVNVGTTASPSYKIVLNTQQTGEDSGYLTINADAAITELQTQTLDQATNAVFSISGISGDIERSKNLVEDVVPGVSFQLIKSGTANITVSNDADATADLVSEIVTAYNDIVSYIEENDTVERVETSSQVTNIFGSLGKTRLDNDFLAAFRLKVAGATSDSGTAVRAFSDLGLSTNRDGTIDFDIDEFKSQLALDPTGTSEVLTDFANSVSGISGLIYQYTKFNGLIDIAQKGNDNEIENITEAINKLDRTNEGLRTRLEAQFTRLETMASQMQSSQQAITQILSSL
jgi:flagellar hook-associated protein 2